MGNLLAVLKNLVFRMGVGAVATEPTFPVPQVPTNAPDWESIPGSSRLQEWALQLRQACSATADADSPWELAGHAAVFIGADESACADAARRVAVDAGLRFVSIVDDDVVALESLAAFEQYAPALVYLEPGRWMKEKADKEDAELIATMQRFQSSLVAWLRDFDPEHPVVVVTSCDEITGLDVSLRHAGLFDRFLALQTPTMDALGHAFIQRIGRTYCGATITEHPGKVGVLFSREYETERRRRLAVLRLRRLAVSQRRDLEFLDLVNVALHGFTESDALPVSSESSRRQAAWHEAGHALISVIDSNGRNVPEYSSIVPYADCEGVVVDSYKYLLEYGDQMTYADMRYKVRVGLAGRAAEELLCGPELVSNGSREDLKKVTLCAGSAFSFWGFAPAMDKEGQSGSNLAVSGINDDPFTVSEAAHTEALVRAFLATEYEVVMELLRTHRALLDAIAERLLADAVVGQEALEGMVREHASVGTAAQELALR